MRRMALMNITETNAAFLQFFLVIVLGGGSLAQLSSKIKAYLKCISCLLISKVDIGILRQYFWINQILAWAFPL